MYIITNVSALRSSRERVTTSPCDHCQAARAVSPTITARPASDSARHVWSEIPYARRGTQSRGNTRGDEYVEVKILYRDIDEDSKGFSSSSRRDPRTLNRDGTRVGVYETAG
jgi:hypothetical protein